MVLNSINRVKGDRRRRRGEERLGRSKGEEERRPGRRNSIKRKKRRRGREGVEGGPMEPSLQ